MELQETVLWEGGGPNGTADLNLDDTFDNENEVNEEAPYGYKKDGTPAKKRGRPAGASNLSSSGGGAPRSKSVSALEREIFEAIGGDLAATVGTVAPMVAYVLDDRAERTAHALANIASRSPNFKKGLEKALVYRDFLTLAALPPAIAVAIALEVGIIKPDSAMSRRFRLYEPYMAMYGEQGSEVSPEYQAPRPIGLLSEG